MQVLQNSAVHNGQYGIEVTGVNATVIGNNVTNTTYAGIYVHDGANATVRGNTATGNGGSGINVSSNNAIITNDNVIHDNKGNGLTVSGSNIILAGFNIYNNGQYGIEVTGVNATVIGNNVTNTTYAGIYVHDGANATVSGNTATGNGGSGINVSSNNATIRGNTATGNNGSGIYVVGNYATITNDNIIHDNKGTGLYVSGSNITLTGFNIYNNGVYGIEVNGVNATLTGNTVTNSTSSGIYVHGGDNATISGNNATGNGGSGINVSSNNAIITGNTVTNNQYGIYLSSSSANVNFNRIVGNSKYGLYNTGNGIVNATNNWWGSNNDLVVSSSIYIAGGNVTYNPWLVLNITAIPPSTNSSSTITADVTHNNAGEDTSSQGHIPDDIPITFITNIGTITSPAYTRNGKAITTFSHGTCISGLANITATLDNQTVQTTVTKPLTVAVSQVGGWYNTTQTVTLTPIEPDSNLTIYYTTDGSDPQVNGIVYSNPIPINTTTTLKYSAVDPAGNWGPEYTQTYIIDTTPPTVTVNILGGIYNTTQTVNLTVTDNLDPNPVIYYTTDGSDPTTSSTIYIDPITLQMNNTIRNITILKFMAVDQAGNHAQIQTENYALTLLVVDINTNNCYSKIQDAIDNPLTLNDHVIQIYSGTFVENVLVNKKLDIMPVYGNNVIIQAADPSQPVFTINSDGNSSIIQGFTINGNVNLYANNCTIFGNMINGNGTSGIITSNSFNNTIFNNTITSNSFDGIHSSYSNNTIYGNTIYSTNSGIYSEYSNNTITSNTLKNNYYGIWTYNSTDTIQFNRITGNTYGLRNDIGTVNATNNWWGSNADPSTNSSDIWNVSGNVNSSTWLVLNVNASSTNSGGNTSVTADLTHNNQGADTSSRGHVPNGILVNFTTTFGTIVNSSYTVKGKAATILNLGSTQTATVTATASLDNQNVSTTGVIATGSAVLNITSTAIDNSTGQPLNITYSIPLNESVTWLSVLWIPTTISGISAPTDELQMVVDGNVVLDRYIYNNNGLNNDTLTVNLAYPGVSGLNLTVTDPNSSDVTNLTFPGNVIHRTSQIVYNGTPYEGVQSFAIATTEVTPDILNYWLNQYSNYQSPDAMNVAYATFLTALMVEYAHDQIADNITRQYNVTWSRTGPIIVSACEDADETYLTLESDHSMGMTVVGTPETIRIFNLITSFYISLIEYGIISGITGNPYQLCSSNGDFSSVTLDLYNDYLFNNTSVKVFVQNGYIIEKSVISDDDFIVIDPETGIVRDINTVNNFCGVFRPPQTYIHITGGFKRGVTNTGELVNLGTFNFYWFGLGEVLISSNPQGTGSITADDVLNITGPNGTEYHNYGGLFWGSPLDITHILQFGSNSIQVEIKDLYGGLIGCSSLYIVLVNPLGNPNYHDIWANNTYNLGNNLLNGTNSLFNTNPYSNYNITNTTGNSNAEVPEPVKQIGKDFLSYETETMIMANIDAFEENPGVLEAEGIGIWILILLLLA